jgi:pSer/pThr/pTyr-binding forkhead associated (FHA) protein
MITLRVNRNGEPQASYSLNQDEITLGRDKACDVTLASRAVSRKHAVIHMHDKGFTIADLYSANGTVVNNRCITTCDIGDGDEIVIAPFHIEVDVV